MSSTSESKHLSGHHRDTLLRIFQHPASHNVDWQARCHCSKLLDQSNSATTASTLSAIRAGPETEVFKSPEAQGHRCPAGSRRAQNVG